MIIADRPLKDYEQFIQEGLQTLSCYDVRGIAVVAVLEGADDGKMFTGYHNLSLLDKEAVVESIRDDCTEELIRANLHRWLDELDEEDYDNDMDEEDEQDE